MEHLLLISVFANIILIVLVLAKGRRLNIVHKYFTAFLLITSIWAFANFLLLMYPWSIQILRTTYALGALVAATAVAWILRFSQKNKSFKVDLILVSLGIVFFIVSFITNGVVRSLELTNEVYKFESGPLHIFFIVFAAIMILLVWWALISAFATGKGIFREQAKYILFGASIFSGGEFVSNVIFPLAGFRPVAFWDGILPVFFIIPAAYAMIRYRFMDVRFILRKGTVYGVTLMIVLGIYIYFMFLLSRFAESFFSVNYQIASIAGVVFIALGFAPLKKLVNNFLDSYVFNKQINSKAFLEKIRQQLDAKRPVEDFAGTLRKEIKKNLKVEFAELVIPNYRPTGDWEIIEPEIKSLDKLIQSRSLLSFYFARNNDIIVVEEIPFRIEEIDNKEEKELLDKISRLCSDLKIGIIAPIKTQDELVGLFILGTKKDGKIYLAEEINYIKDLRENLTLTLSSALLYYKAIWRIKNEYNIIKK